MWISALARALKGTRKHVDLADQLTRRFHTPVCHREREERGRGDPAVDRLTALSVVEGLDGLLRRCAFLLMNTLVCHCEGGLPTAAIHGGL